VDTAPDVVVDTGRCVYGMLDEGYGFNAITGNCSTVLARTADIERPGAHVDDHVGPHRHCPLALHVGDTQRVGDDRQ
jgi:hypothetical protein